MAQSVQQIVEELSSTNSKKTQQTITFEDKTVVSSTFYSAVTLTLTSDLDS